MRDFVLTRIKQLHSSAGPTGPPSSWDQESRVAAWVAPPACLLILRGNEKVAGRALTARLITVDHLARLRGNEKKFSADREVLFPHSHLPVNPAGG